MVLIPAQGVGCQLVAHAVPDHGRAINGSPTLPPTCMGQRGRLLQFSKILIILFAEPNCYLAVFRSRRRQLGSGKGAPRPLGGSCPPEPPRHGDFFEF